MNKAVIVILLILIAAFSLGKVYSHAKEKEEINNLKLNKAVSVDENFKLFQTSGEGNDKTQFRIKNNHNDENSEFMIKGVISASSSDSITIDGKEVKIDSSVTGDTKIVGKPDVGTYAMIKGIIVNSDKYAEKIIVNQRNKNEENEIEENENDENNEEDEIIPTTTVTPTITPTVTITPTPIGTESASVDVSQQIATTSNLGDIIVAIQNFLNYLKDLASKI